MLKVSKASLFEAKSLHHRQEQIVLSVGEHYVFAQVHRKVDNRLNSYGLPSRLESLNIGKLELTELFMERCFKNEKSLRQFSQWKIK